MKRALFFFLSAFLLVQFTGAQETQTQRDQRMQWWREAKFGLFIHWGVYSVPAGTYKGEQIKGIGEWIMRNAEIPVAEYRGYAKQFNPLKYDPKFWARLAKEAGMRYMVITSKHHDGFALFPSAVSDWDVQDAAPYAKDLIGPLAKAARKQGLKFGLYYSQAQDWTNPGGAKARMKEGEFWDPAQKGSFDDYIKNVAVPQTREILTNYQPDILWWDTPVWMTLERAAPLYALLSLRPGIITNNRLAAEYKGDTDTPEQYIPATGIPGRDWEVCMTMNDTWGFKSYDLNWKSTAELIIKLVDIVSKGGNFLLNVGPTAEGEIPQASIERLQAVGQWMRVNAEAIYATTASPFHRLTWGRCTKKVHKNSTTLYLHVFDWPQEGELVLPGIRNNPKKARLLASGQILKAYPMGKDIRISVPRQAPDAVNSVIKLEIAGQPDVESNMPVESADGSVYLSAEMADINNPGYGEHAVLQGKGQEAVITNWTDARARLAWVFKLPKPGKFRVSAEVACTEDTSRFTFKLTGKSLEVALLGSGLTNFNKVELGEIEVKTIENTVLQITPDAKKWHELNLRSVKLQRVP